MNEDILNLSISELADAYLSRRTINALKNNQIETLGDLCVLSDRELMDFRGLGKKGLTEIKRLIDEADKISIIPKPPKEDLIDWIFNNIKAKHLVIVMELYGVLDDRPLTLSEIASTRNVSRERIRQIKNRVIEKIQHAIDAEKVDIDILDKITALAKEGAPIHGAQKAGMLGFLVEFTDQCTIVNIDALKSPWLIMCDMEEDLTRQVRDAVEWLEAQVGYVPIDQLSKQAHVSENLLRDLKRVDITDDDYIALTNSRGETIVNRDALVLNSMRENISPMSIQELVAKTGLPDGVIRGIVYRNQEIVNIGRSIYALKEFGYSDKDTKELAYDYLQECGEPRHISDIRSYILHHRMVGEKAIDAAIYTSPELFTRFSNGFVALADWGYQSDVKKRKVYEVPIREAILSVLKDHPERSLSNRDLSNEILKKYGDKASSAQVTVSAETQKLVEEGVIDRLGTSTGYFKCK